MTTATKTENVAISAKPQSELVEDAAAVLVQLARHNDFVIKCEGGNISFNFTKKGA